MPGPSSTTTQALRIAPATAMMDAILAMEKNRIFLPPGNIGSSHNARRAKLIHLFHKVVIVSMLPTEPEGTSDISVGCSGGKPGEQIT